MPVADPSVVGTHRPVNGTHYTASGTSVSRGKFELQADVHKNVYELRVFLGVDEGELSLARLAARLNARDGRRRSASTIQRWEEGAEPDYESTKLMAEMAGVRFEQFALGDAAPSGGTLNPETEGTLSEEDEARMRAQAAKERESSQRPENGDKTG
jgi:hypothetical protein